MEKHIQDELRIIKDIIIKTVPVKQIFLFGSYASGNPNVNSDLDIFVVIPDNAGIREIDAMRLIRKAIREKKKMSVDIVVSKENKFSQRKLAPTIERQIVKEGILLYG